MNPRLAGCAFWVVAAAILGGLLWYLYRPAPLPASVDPTPTMLVIVTDPTRPAASPPPHTPTPPEPILLTKPDTIRQNPTLTDTPVPPTGTPDRTPVQKG